MTGPDFWKHHLVLDGKFYRYVDETIPLPLIEIKESELHRLEGYEFFEPSWVVARPPTAFAVFDRENKLLFGPDGYAPDYSLEEVLLAHDYDSEKQFRVEHGASLLPFPVRDMDIWVKLGLPAKVYLPSLKRKS